LVLVLFNIYIDRVIKGWLQVIKKNILAKDLILNIILFVYNQLIMTGTADEMHRAVYAVSSIPIKYNLKISVNKTKVMTVKRNRNVRSRIRILNNRTRYMDTIV
jgi:hypothetical protein